MVPSFLQPSKPLVQTSPEFSLTHLHQEWQITESQIQASLCWQNTMPNAKQKEL